jgi:hypothetical protein
MSRNGTLRTRQTTATALSAGAAARIAGVVGVGTLLVANLAWRRHPRAPLLTVGVGTSLAIIGYSNHPPLQPLYIGVGVGIVAVGIAWTRRGGRAAA